MGMIKVPGWVREAWSRGRGGRMKEKLGELGREDERKLRGTER